MYRTLIDNQLHVINTTKASVTFRVIDINGKLLLERNILGTQTLDAAGWKSGVYYYEVVGNHNLQQRGKLVVR